MSSTFLGEAVAGDGAVYPIVGFYVTVFCEAVQTGGGVAGGEVDFVCDVVRVMELCCDG